MLSTLFKKLHRAIWTFGQPLSYRPKIIHAQVSDLFIWRNSDEYQTFFELITLSGLLGEFDSEQNRKVRFEFYNSDGERVFELFLDSHANKRQTINLSQYLPANAGSIGTFCVFHGPTPSEISSVGSFLAERGYVSYRYRNAPLRSYVHGNFDAVALYERAEQEFLGGVGMFQREFRLQYRLFTGTFYEFALTNTTPYTQSVEVMVASNINGEKVWQRTAALQSGSIHVFRPKIKTGDSFRIIIRSYLVMARPLVFITRNGKLDVFHG
jgi:hypothetical protein